jgi:copper chaperone CopZ
MFRAMFFAAFAALLAGCSGGSMPTSASSDRGNAAADATGELTPVTFRVPTMVCTKNCWPAVRDALQKQPGVQDVTLAPQQEEIAIDNPLVTVTRNGSFDAEQAIEAIAAAGFGNATVEK